ncbi:anti-sigma factor [Phenylobacterium sp.]|jgi:anti-sigma-K factor RskA|uniref:anti-sigma factor n=1 Tax=Phenylobacterium sp. TaxID=1871053 RepID=UPI002F3F7C52
MSEAPELSEAEALAAEHALGVLGSAERREAEARMASDPAFAAEVEAWRERLMPMAENVNGIAAPQALWLRIERSLGANDNLEAVRGLRFWRGTAAGSLTLAAASVAVAVMLANQPVRTVVAPTGAQQGQLLDASLVSQSGAPVPLFVAAYDPTRKALIVTSLVTPNNDPAHVHELWVIPADGKPRPLGILEPGKTKAIPMPEKYLPSLAAGSALAVSVEPPGGSPKVDAPSGPITAVGKLAKI